ncbi:MAG: methyltransferase [Bdellovibrionales bacterium]|nr:methyltransferase [Bdellovibrionales bacterium]
MSLTLVSVPIGNPGDITLRARRTLAECTLVIGEERKPLFRLHRELDLPRPENFELLNEHSTPDEVTALAKLCHEQKVALVTDCGTPGFSDPGAHLVKSCRELGIPVTANPGASSLTTFISLLGVPLKRFHFEGFLPRENSERSQRLKEISQIKIPVILMDTPYRLNKLLGECAQIFDKRSCVLGVNLTKEDEAILTGSVSQVSKNYDGEKREFLILIY